MITTITLLSYPLSLSRDGEYNSMLTRFAICANCDSTTRINLHGKCSFCGSDSIIILGTHKELQRKKGKVADIIVFKRIHERKRNKA